MKKKTEKELVEEVKKKKEFSKLPDSIITRALELTKQDVKEARALLRKYFGMFLTNKVVKGTSVEVLNSHISSKERDYKELYKRIFEVAADVRSVIDFGAGANGYSITQLRDETGIVNYKGVEAAGQLIENTNKFFREEKIKHATYEHGDLFEEGLVKKVVKDLPKKRIAFLFLVVDALEMFERDFSKEFIAKVMKECEYVAITLPLRSISGGTKFAVKRQWLHDHLEKYYKILKNIELKSERLIMVGRKI